MKTAAVRVGLRKAKESLHTFQHCALLVKSGRILQIAVNSHKTDPIFAKDPSLNRNANKNKRIAKLHAEQRAILGVNPEIIRGSDMVIVRISKKKTVGNSSPCRMCREVLKKAGIRKITYTVDYGGLITEKL